jgi:hypothetical protein
MSRNDFDFVEFNFRLHFLSTSRFLHSQVSKPKYVDKKLLVPKAPRNYPLLPSLTTVREIGFANPSEHL